MSSKERLGDHIVPRRVVIVGGGFAGLFAARTFRHSPVEVTVVDRATHHLFQPLAPGMKTLADALTIRRRVFGAFEMAQTATDPAERHRWLTFALVGAGPTGVELAGQIHEVATLTLRNQFRQIDPSETRVLLFDGGAMPLAPFGPKLS